MRNRWIDGALPPPTSEARYYPVLRPEVGKPLRVTLLAPTLWACWTHQLRVGEEGSEIRTKPCLGELRCPHDHVAIPTRWYAFGPAQLLDTKRRCVCMVSLRGAERIEQLSREMADLRGLTIEITKDGGHKAAQYLVSRINRSITGALPEPHPIADSLRKLWAVEELPGDLVAYQAPSEEGRAR